MEFSKNTISFLSIIFLVTSNGCVVVEKLAHVPARIAEHRAMKRELLAEKMKDKEAVHQAKMEDLEDDRTHLAVTREALRVQREREREALKPRYDESISSQLNLGFQQRFSVGQLQVDPVKLKALLAEREKEYADLMKEFEQLEKTRRSKLQDHYLREARAALEAGDEAGARVALQASGCGCAGPLIEKLQDREALKKPIRRPILPTEIPMVLPVTLAVEMENPQIGRASIRRMPLKTRESLKQCKTCELPCNECSCTPDGGRQEQFQPPIPEAINDIGFLNAIPPAPPVDKRSLETSTDVSQQREEKFIRK